MALLFSYTTKALMHIVFRKAIVPLLLVCSMIIGSAQIASAQYEVITNDVEKNKPKKFENKTLRSEKTGEKKFTIPRRIIQNTITHYNFYFNANRKLQEVIERSKSAEKADYTKLLPFFNYSLDNSALQASELDSVILKATAGILLHDLRNSWIDDMYMLIGQSYFLRKDFDSASMAFQFINYNMYPKKRGDDERVIVGSGPESATAISIANPEKKGFTISKKPIRNDALVWQIRTLIQTGALPEAAGLINTLQNDPNFPKRLQPELEEMKGYWFYQQKIFDSAALHLENSMGIDESKSDKARREFLIAQLYEISKLPAKASDYYSKAAKHTTDPLMDIYANLNAAKMVKGSVNDININIADLAKMAKRDKYLNYRDIVFNSAADLALQKPDTALAQVYYLKSIKYNSVNVEAKNKSYLQLADIAYSKKDFRSASSYYDSVKLDNNSIVYDAAMIEERRNDLHKIALLINRIETQDSLQKIAAMPAAQREQIVRSVVRRLRKEKGLKDETFTGSSSSSTFDNNITGSADLFESNNTTGEWYFYNSTAKSRGYNEFRRKWGERQNVDNWRRRSAFQAIQNSRPVIGNPDDISDVVRPNGGIIKPTDINASSVDNIQPSDFSYEGLMGNVPLTEELMKKSNTTLAISYFELGKLYQNTIEDYDMAATTYERSLHRFPDSLYNGELYMNLYYVYLKSGNASKAAYYKSLLANKFPSSAYATAVLNPSAVTANVTSTEASKAYDRIYNYFIEGNFTKALSEKRIADSTYGTTFHTPQLLYIEAVYYVKQKQDSLAILTLQKIVTNFAQSNLKSKASTLIDVIKRRAEIETYLTNLNITPAAQDTAVIIKPITIAAAPQNNIPVKPKPQNPTPPPVNNITAPSVTYTFDPAASHLVVMVLNKVDNTYSSEARNAFNRYNREKFGSAGITVTKDVLDADNTMLLFTSFSNAEQAIAYMKKVRADAKNEVSWLPASKYSFLIISDENLTLLKTNKNVAGYLSALKSNFPADF
ncbi:hypothetical protein BH09BAC2_BH09BAC2_14560 [soil metagenome]